MFSSASASARSVSLQDFADLLEASTVDAQIDLGPALVYKVTHPTSGKLILVNTSEGTCGVLPC